MRKIFNIFFFCLTTTFQIYPQDTFSIVAVDTITGEIGSAGASCVTYQNIGAFIISDVIEGIGAVHTQSYWQPGNQQLAHQYMLLAYSPQQIIDSLVVNDVQGNPHIRQYGVVDLTRKGESAAYTGVNCLNYKNHVTDFTYAIQGNILSGQLIIDTMQTVFLNTEGEPLADRLMQTLQAAKIVGADTRCAVRGTSSQSSFIKVVRLGDNGNFYLQEIVPDSPINVDPIDLLQDRFDNWKLTKFNVVDPFLSELFASTDTLTADDSSKAVITIIPKNNSDTLLVPGLTVVLSNTGSGTLSSVIDLGNGTYEALLTAPLVSGIDTITAIVISGSDTVNVAQNTLIHYVIPTSVDDYKERSGYYLFDNYPNPFNPSTRIRYRVPVNKGYDDHRNNVIVVTLAVYDILGSQVAMLVNKIEQPGNHEVQFIADGLSSGMFFLKMTAGNFVSVKKMMVLK